MRKRIVTIIILVFSFFCAGCTNEFEYGYDKFYLERIEMGGQGNLCYDFRKKIDSDIIMKRLSEEEPNGYELYGEQSIFGFWFFNVIERDGTASIVVSFTSYYSYIISDTKLNIYFNYTVASTGERKEEVWEVDFGQEPYEDKR